MLRVALGEFGTRPVRGPKRVPHEGLKSVGLAFE